MKASELIKELNNIIIHYGDCDVCKIRFFHTQPIDYIKFIGGNRVLLFIDDIIDKDIYNSYINAEKHKNHDRKKAWLKDCEGE